METVGFWFLLLLAQASASTNAPGLQEEETEHNTTLEAELEDKVNILIEVRNK